jgi:hypothetical protein
MFPDERVVILPVTSEAAREESAEEREVTEGIGRDSSQRFVRLRQI